MTRARRAALAAVCGLGLALGAGPGAAADVGDARVRIADLKLEALDRLRQRRAEALAERYPERTRVSIYVNAGADGFRIEQIEVRIDGRAAASREYSRREAASLDARGLHRAVRVNVEPGPHRVAVAFRGRMADADADDEPMTGSIDLAFDKTDRAKALILPLAPERMRPPWVGKRSAWQWRSEPEDPRLGMVRFLRATDRRFAASLELLEIAGAESLIATREAAGDDALPAGYHVLLAHSYLDFGMRQAAYQALNDYARGGAEREPYESVRLRLAALALARGEQGRAGRLLGEMREYLTPAQEVIWQDLMSRLLMAQQRYRQAVTVLDRGGNALEVLTQPEGTDTQSLYMRYNHAIAMLRAGQTDRGRTLLDRIGRMTAFDGEQRALRDRANVALGFHFLAREQGATAKKIFQRVRLRGPYSSRALLGLGRAELAPRGTRQPRVAVGDEPAAGTYGIADTESGRIRRDDRPDRYAPDAFSQVQLKPFLMAETAEAPAAARGRALVAWRELAERGTAEPAMQEAALAVGHVLEQAGAYGAAQRTYRRAVADIASAEAELGRTIAALRSGPAPVPAATSATALGRQWRGRALAALPETRWLQEMLAGPRFHEALANILDLQVLAEALRSPGADGFSVQPAAMGAPPTDGRLAASLLAAADAEALRMQGLAAEALAEQRERVGAYLRAARRGVARVSLRAALGDDNGSAGSGASAGSTAKAVRADDPG